MGSPRGSDDGGEKNYLRMLYYFLRGRIFLIRMLVHNITLLRRRKMCCILILFYMYSRYYCRSEYLYVRTQRRQVLKMSRGAHCFLDHDVQIYLNLTGHFIFLFS